MGNNVRFDLRQIKDFIAVAEALHFKKAAEALFITQPALSRLIKGLEEEVGAHLLARTTRQVNLTESGRLFLEECRQVFLHIDRGVYLARRAAAGDIGHITVAYNDFSINGVLPRILERFKECHPEVGIELVYMPSHEQHKALRDLLIDIGFLIGPLAVEGIETHRVVYERTTVILPVRHPLAHRSSIRAAELADEKFILGSESGWSEYRAYVLKVCLRAGFTPNVIQEATTSNGIFGLVAANMGISLYSDCVKKFQREDIAVVPLEGESTAIETVAAWSKSYESPSARLFKELLKSEMTPGDWQD